MKQHSFTDFVYEVIGELRQENRFATAYIYHYALQAFTASVGGGKIFWGGLNRRSLCKFQYYLEKEQKSYNTTSTYIRALRAIYNRAVDRGAVAGECRLFVNLKTGVSSEHKLALTARQTSRWVMLLTESILPADSPVLYSLRRCTGRRTQCD